MGRRICLQEGVPSEIDNSTETPSKFDFGIAAEQRTHSHALETLHTREIHTRRAENTHRARAALKNNGAEGKKKSPQTGFEPRSKKMVPDCLTTRVQRVYCTTQLLPHRELAP